MGSTASKSSSSIPAPYLSHWWSARERCSKSKKLDREKFTYGRALNVGCVAGAGDYLAILNGHTIPIGTSWLKDITAPLGDPSLAAVCGLQNGAWPNRRNLEQTLLDVSNFGPPRWAGMSAANLVVRREVWEQFPFNERIPYAEDKEWGHRVTGAGWNILLGAEATIHHAHPERKFRSHLWYVYMTAQSQILYAHTPVADNERARLMDCWIRAPRVGFKTMIKTVRLAQAHFRGIRAAKRNRAKLEKGLFS